MKLIRSEVDNINSPKKFKIGRRTVNFNKTINYIKLEI